MRSITTPTLNAKKKMVLDTWNRKAHFDFFSGFDEPFFGVTVPIEVTTAYKKAKQRNQSFFLYYLYRALKAANSIENFKYGIIEKEVFLYEQMHASATVDRPDGTFGFSYITFYDEEALFYEKATLAIAETRKGTGLFPSNAGENVMHCSAVPWLNFTALSHARNYKFPDSCPKLSFGKMTRQGDKLIMPVAVYLHHGLADGLHIGMFTEKFEALMMA
ncbi:CatA-like O-acetyltransferase [Zhouia sp. PK063]|uniref:CatA-like O-acetyltransferase n=1 Tax=Zhouia sp. PK063 TaxID=3373602 RepID=UPI00379B1875